MELTNLIVRYKTLCFHYWIERDTIVFYFSTTKHYYSSLDIEWHYFSCSFKTLLFPIVTATADVFSPAINQNVFSALVNITSQLYFCHHCRNALLPSYLSTQPMFVLQVLININRKMFFSWRNSMIYLNFVQTFMSGDRLLM